MIIGIAGRIYAGKDETAKTIQRLTSLKYSVEDEFGDRARDIKGNYITEYRNTWKLKSLRVN
jgi:dephospho-CoA kinase